MFCLGWKSNYDYFSFLPNDIIVEILQSIILNYNITFGKNTKNNIIENILSLVCTEWKLFIDNISKHTYLYTTDYYFELYNSLMTVKNQSCNFIYHDCTGFKKLDINWKKNYQLSNISKKKNCPLSEIMIINNFSFDGEKNDFDINSEITRWIGCVNKLNHINISKLLMFGINENQFYMVFEPTDTSLNMLLYGNYQHSREYINKFNPQLIESIMYQLLSALEYCHSNNICHGNISPHRILFKIVPEGLLLKLADFKHSPSLVTQNDRKNQPIMPSYRSPELVENYIYSEKNDIWAAGQMMILMSSEYFIGTPYQVGYDNFYKLLESNNYCQQTKKLLYGLINSDYRLRYTAKQSLRQPYFHKTANWCPVIKKYLPKSKYLTKCQNNDSYMINHWIPSSKAFLSHQLFKKNEQINIGCWEILVDWLIEVSEKFRLSDCVLSIACQYLYVYLNYHDVSRKKLQLVGCGALYLACTWTENLIPPLSDFVYISANAFNLEDIDKIVQDILLKLQGNLWNYTFTDYQNDYINQLYNKNLSKWNSILLSLTNMNPSLVLMPQKLLYSNLVFLMDLINEIITGKSNIELRQKIFNFDAFKQQHFNFINLFHHTFSKLSPYKYCPENNNEITYNKDMKFILSRKTFEKYKLLQPMERVLKNLSKNKINNKNAVKISYELCSRIRDFNNLNKLNENTNKSNIEQKNNNTCSIYLLTLSVLNYRINNITYFPLKDTFEDFLS